MTEPTKPWQHRFLVMLDKRSPATLRWWLGFDTRVDSSQFVEELRLLEFDGSRTKDLLEYSKELRKEALDGYKLANDRAEKLLGVTLIMCGWIFTSAKPSTTWIGTILWILSASAFLLVIATLMFGRWKLQARLPATFPKMAKYAHDIATDSEDEWNFVQARQYAIAAFENQLLTGKVHRRLLLAISLLLAGLVAFALRGV